MAPSAISEQTNAVEEQPYAMVKKFLTMNGGDGDSSYAKCSSYQKHINDSAYSALGSCLERLNLPAADHGPFVISDLGCSSGPNTIQIVSDVVKIVKELYQERGQDIPEFKAYFNDLHSTDFNFLFQQLDSESRDYYYAGAPGSFYGRIFPRSSVNLFLTTNALHWSSQISPAVTDKNSAAYNKDKIWIQGNSVDVIQAYKQQGVDDMRSFLDARAEELVPGGLLFCIFGSAGDGYSSEIWRRTLSDVKLSSTQLLMNAFEHVWEQLITEGILTKEQRTLCNIPWYMFTTEELEETLKSYDDIFRIEVLDHVELPGTTGGAQKLFDGESDEDLIARHLASIWGPFFTAIIGKESTSALFNRAAQYYWEGQRNAPESVYGSHVLALIKK